IEPVQVGSLVHGADTISLQYPSKAVATAQQIGCAWMSLFTAGLRMSLFTAGLRMSLFTAGLRMSLFAAGLRMSLFTAGLRMSLFTAGLRNINGRKRRGFRYGGGRRLIFRLRRTGERRGGE